MDVAAPVKKTRKGRKAKLEVPKIKMSPQIANLKKLRTRIMPWEKHKDTTPIHFYLTRLTTEERIKVVRYFDFYEDYRKMRNAWKKDFGTTPPVVKTIQRICEKFDKFGHIWDDPEKLGGKRLDQSIVDSRLEFIRNAIRENPQRKTESIAEEMGIGSSIVASIIRVNALSSKHYSGRYVMELKDRIAELESEIGVLEGREPTYINKKPKKDPVRFQDYRSRKAKAKAKLSKASSVISLLSKSEELSKSIKLAKKAKLARYVKPKRTKRPDRVPLEQGLDHDPDFELGEEIARQLTLQQGLGMNSKRNVKIPKRKNAKKSSKTDIQPPLRGTKSIPKPVVRLPRNLGISQCKKVRFARPIESDSFDVEPEIVDLELNSAGEEMYGEPSTGIDEISDRIMNLDEVAEEDIGELELHELSREEFNQLNMNLWKEGEFCKDRD